MTEENEQYLKSILPQVEVEELMGKLDGYAADLMDGADKGFIHDNYDRARKDLYKLMNKTKDLTDCVIRPLPMDNPTVLAEIILVYNELLKTQGFYKLGLEKRNLLPPESTQGVGGYHTL